MKVIFSGQVPKELAYSDANEDVIEIAIDIGRVAVSDGASESFDSKTWARLLTQRFVENPELKKNWVDNAVAAYSRQFERDKMSWSKQAAFDRGSYATLLGIEHCIDHGEVDVWGVGDSVAVFLDCDNFIDSYPYKNAEEFQRRPELFSTKATLNSFFYAKDFFSRHHKTWEIRNKTSPVILCMTDALGEWALRNEQEGHPKWQMLNKIEDQSELEALVFRERRASNLRTDDTTLVKLSFKRVLE